MKKVGIWDTFNRLTIIGDGKKVPKVKKFICKCTCGNIVEVESYKEDIEDDYNVS